MDQLAVDEHAQGREGDAAVQAGGVLLAGLQEENSRDKVGGLLQYTLL